MLPPPEAPSVVVTHCEREPGLLYRIRAEGRGEIEHVIWQSTESRPIGEKLVVSVQWCMHSKDVLSWKRRTK